MSDERWLPVVGYEGIYEVSDMGRVRSLMARGKWSAGRVLRFRNDKFGYLKVGLTKDRVQRFFFVHRLVATAFFGSPTTDRPHINHKNGTKTDNRLENLEWCSPRENMQHSVMTGLRIAIRGERIGTAKLTAANVLAIRASTSVAHGDLANRYGVARSTISMVIGRKNWAHIPDANKVSP